MGISFSHILPDNLRFLYLTFVFYESYCVWMHIPAVFDSCLGIIQQPDETKKLRLQTGFQRSAFVLSVPDILFVWIGISNTGYQETIQDYLKIRFSQGFLSVPLAAIKHLADKSAGDGLGNKQVYI